jgi:UDP-glucose 4-epimerase
VVTFGVEGALKGMGVCGTPDSCKWLCRSAKAFLSLEMTTQHSTEPVCEDYIRVIDLAQAHFLALGALENGSRYYNLGNGEGFSVKQVIDTAREITGKDIPTEVGPRRAGDPAVLVAASDRIRKELGWIPKFPHVREIIESAWRWHQSNPAGYLQ